MADLVVGAGDAMQQHCFKCRQPAPSPPHSHQVFCTHTEPNFSLPWQRKRQMNSTSSGFLATFEGRRVLLTNAHSVDYHTQVRGAAAVGVDWVGWRAEGLLPAPHVPGAEGN